MRKKNLSILGIILFLIIGLFLLNSEVLRGLFSAVSGVGFSDDRVVLPVFGSYKCEEGSFVQKPNIILSGTGEIAVKSFSSNDSRPHTVDILYPISTGLGISPVQTIAKKCDAKQCKFEGIGTSSLVCSSGYTLIFRATGGGAWTEQIATNITN